MAEQAKAASHGRRTFHLSIATRASPHRNETRDRYLVAMDEYGKGGLMPVIIAQEANSESTQLRKLMEDDRTKGRSDMLLLLASTKDALLGAIIDRQLPRKAEIADRAVYNAQGKSESGTYLNAICDRMVHQRNELWLAMACSTTDILIMVTTILLKRWTN